jgi:hypothetical protein
MLACCDVERRLVKSKLAELDKASSMVQKFNQGITSDRSTGQSNGAFRERRPP